MKLYISVQDPFIWLPIVIFKALRYLNLLSTVTVIKCPSFWHNVVPNWQGWAST